MRDVELRDAVGFLPDSGSGETVVAVLELCNALWAELDEAFGHRYHDLKFVPHYCPDLGGWQVFATGGAEV